MTHVNYECFGVLPIEVLKNSCEKGYLIVHIEIQYAVTQRSSLTTLDSGITFIPAILREKIMSASYRHNTSQKPYLIEFCSEPFSGRLCMV